MPALRRLDPAKYLFAVEYCKNGGRASAAVRVVYPDASNQHAANLGPQWLADEDVQEAIEKVWKQRERNSPMTMEEKRRWLTEAINTPLSEVDEHSLFARKVTRKIRRDENGETETVQVEKVDPLQCLDMDNKLAGHYAPTVHLSGGSADMQDMLSRIMGVAPPAPLTLEAETPDGAPPEDDEDWL